jgi:aminomethyltransferase
MCFRSHCGLFDVSHMLQSHVYGRDRIKFIESLTVADVEGLAPNSGTLSLFTTDQGTISDDLIITKTDSDFIYLVTNAGCREKDVKLMRDREIDMKKYVQ